MSERIFFVSVFVCFGLYVAKRLGSEGVPGEPGDYSTLMLLLVLIKPSLGARTLPSA